MDEIIPYELKSRLIIVIIFFIFLFLVQTLLSSFRQHMILYLGRKIDLPVTLGYFNHILNLPLQFLENKRVGDILTRFQDSGTIKDIVTSLSVSLLLDVLLAIFSTILLININFHLYLLLLIELIILVIMIYLFKRPYESLNFELMIANSTLNSYLIESLQNIETIKSYGNEKNTIYSLEKKLVELLELSFKGGILQNIQTTISQLINGIFPIIMYGVGTWFILENKMSIGDLLFFQTLSVYFMQPIQNLASLQLTFQEAKIALHRLNELMDTKQEDSINTSIAPNLKGKIQFNNVSFNYNKRKSIFKNVNLIINHKEKIALIGKSGSGKSTLAKLIVGYIKPKDGSILINGYNSLDIDVTYLRSKIRYVSQNPILFTGTILENLTYGCLEKNLDEINSVCKIVGLTSFIDSLPKRLNTVITENGVNLSIGEKQRICIARALLSGGDIFIFDESTSNLDEYNESYFREIIRNYLREKTVIIISHKESMVEICDLIYEINNGEIKPIINNNQNIKSDIFSKGKMVSYE